MPLVDDPSDFPGGVFHASLPDGRAGATISLDHGAILAQTGNGKRFKLAYGDCRLEVGGSSGRMWFCRSEDRSLAIFCEAKTFPDLLRTMAGGALDDQFAAAAGSRRQGLGNERRFLVGIVLIILVLGVGGWFAVTAGARAAIVHLPIEVDQKIGKLAFDSMDKQGTPLTDPLVVEAVEAMVARLVAVSTLPDLPFHVQVIDAPVLNAFALPGGYVVVYTELLRQAPSADAVAGVLAHEIAHVTRRHGIQSVARSVGVIIGVQVLVGDVGGLVAVAVQAVTNLALNSYSRDQEAEADATGVTMLHAAGIDPRGLAAFFTVLSESQKDEMTIPEWASTHPDHAQRIAAIHAQADGFAVTTYTPAHPDWPAVQARLAALAGHDIAAPDPSETPVETDSDDTDH